MLIEQLTPPASTIPEDLILWDVVEEHLEEAAFLFTQRLNALDSALYTLDEVEAGPEQRMLAHLDGLLIAGPSAFERLLAPLLQAPDDAEEDELVVAVIMASVLSEIEAVKAGLLAAGEEAARTIATGIGLVTFDDGFDAWLTEEYGKRGDATKVGALLWAAAARRLQLPGLIASLSSEDEGERLAAVAASRFSGEEGVTSTLESMLPTDDDRLRDSVIEELLYRGSIKALGKCRSLARAADGNLEAPLLWLGLLGTREDHALLTAALESEEHRRHALRAIGFSGNVALVDSVLPLLSDEDSSVARLAAEALSLLIGFDLEDEGFLREEEEASDEEEAAAALPDLANDDLDADLGPDDEEDIPLLDGEKVVSWWGERAGGFDASKRHLFGESSPLVGAAKVLQSGRTRDRVPVARLLSVVSRGALVLNTQGFCRDQRSAGMAVDGMDERVFDRFGAW